MADSSGKPWKMPTDSRYRILCITIMTISRAIVFLKGVANDLNGARQNFGTSCFRISSNMLMMLPEYTYFLEDEFFFKRMIILRDFWIRWRNVYISHLIVTNY